MIEQPLDALLVRLPPGVPRCRSGAATRRSSGRSASVAGAAHRERPRPAARARARRSAARRGAFGSCRSSPATRPRSRRPRGERRSRPAAAADRRGERLLRRRNARPREDEVVRRRPQRGADDLTDRPRRARAGALGRAAGCPAASPRCPRIRLCRASSASSSPCARSRNSTGVGELDDLHAIIVTSRNLCILA